MKGKGMESVDPTAGGSEAEQGHVFRKSMPFRVMLHEILRTVGSTDGQACLDVGSPNGMLSRLLRENGGKWQSVAVNERDAAGLSAMLEEGTVHSAPPGELPFKRKSFDAVVILNVLERAPSDETFIEECHRVLKPDGRLFVHTAHVKPWSCLTPFRTVCGMSPEHLGLRRPGYTESELFSLLKNGFNVLNVKSYSRFFIELVDVFVQGRLRRLASQGVDAPARRMRVYSVAAPFYRVADQLDLLLFFTRGHRLLASANRRTWRPRNAPVLVDGRSISEAVLSRPGA